MASLCRKCGSTYSGSLPACPSCGADNAAKAAKAAIAHTYTPGQTWRPADEPIVYRDRRKLIAELKAQAGFMTPGHLWAEQLKAREESGEALLPAQSRAWREALANVAPVADRDPGSDDE